MQLVKEDDHVDGDERPGHDRHGALGMVSRIGITLGGLRFPSIPDDYGAPSTVGPPTLRIPRGP